MLSTMWALLEPHDCSLHSLLCSPLCHSAQCLIVKTTLPHSATLTEIVDSDIVVKLS